MPSQRYERIPAADQEDRVSAVPDSPPPPFQSRSGSPNASSLRRTGTSNVDSTLEDTFNVHSDDEEDERDEDDRQRLMQTSGSIEDSTNGSSVTRPAWRSGDAAPMTSFASSNDGVFANLNAKPERGEKLEEQPPSYEQAAADATPPYWETTILAPGMVSDEVYIDGLPVGSVFSFAWNGIISMAFQLVGFLLTYLLHTTHAAKNGSRAGLGVTLITWGYQMKQTMDRGNTGPTPDSAYEQPGQPNSHDFDPTVVADSMSGAIRRTMAAAGSTAVPTGEQQGESMAAGWLAYVVMIVGWMILLKAVLDFIKARRHEQLILQSPDRVGVGVVAEAEGIETAV